MRNRRIYKKEWNFQNKLNLLLILVLLLVIGLACSSAEKKNYAAKLGEQDEIKESTENLPKRLESYTLRGFKFAYYLVPKDVSREELTQLAQQIHAVEPDTQLILVDDDSKLSEYINYSKEISKGSGGIKLPKDWAGMHIVGNVQKYLSGKWMLCEGNGYREIAELK